MHWHAILIATLVTQAAPSKPPDPKTRQDIEIVAQARQIIDKIRGETDEDVRADSSFKLATLIQKHASVTFEPTIVADLSRLLSDDSERVRYWVAMALGHMGPGARAALPALEQALKERPGMPGRK